MSPVHAVEQHSDADAGRTRTRQVLDLALIGTNLGLDATGDVDLYLFISIRRFEETLGLLEKVTHAAAPPMVIALRRIVA